MDIEHAKVHFAKKANWAWKGQMVIGLWTVETTQLD